MRVETYNPSDMSVLVSDITTLEFGTVIKGQHSNVIAFRPIATEAESNSFIELGLFLENNAGLTHTLFGKHKSTDAATGIENENLTGNFVQVTGISDTTQMDIFGRYGLVYDAGNPEYTWIDVNPSVYETNLGNSSVNFRFVFEYA